MVKTEDGDLVVDDEGNLQVGRETLNDITTGSESQPIGKVNGSEMSVTIQSRIDKLKDGIKEEDIVRANHVEMAGRLQTTITAKIGAIQELTALIKKE